MASKTILTTETREPEKGEYRAQSGLIHCSACGDPKQTRVNLGKWHGVNVDADGIPYKKPANFRETENYRTFPIACLCMKLRKGEEYREQKMKAAAMEAQELKQQGIKDQKFKEYTFEKDDKRNPELSQMFYQYFEQFETMKEEQRGLILYGGTGTGKTYFACAVANELMKFGYSAMVSNLPTMLLQMQGKVNEQTALLNAIEKVDLLVIDDFGVERETNWTTEKIYQILDARSRSKKPMIVTTNLSPSQMGAFTEISQKRILERLKDSAQALIEITGNSRRGEIAGKKMRETMDKLVQEGLEKTGGEERAKE